MPARFAIYLSPTLEVEGGCVALAPRRVRTCNWPSKENKRSRVLSLRRRVQERIGMAIRTPCETKRKYSMGATASRPLFCPAGFCSLPGRSPEVLASIPSVRGKMPLAEFERLVLQRRRHG